MKNEMNLERSSHPNLDGLPNLEFLFGPSLQWRPNGRLHLDFVPLLGVTRNSPRVEAYVVFGIDLWEPRSERGAYAPVSTDSR